MTDEEDRVEVTSPHSKRVLTSDRALDRLRPGDTANLYDKRTKIKVAEITRCKTCNRPRYNGYVADLYSFGDARTPDEALKRVHEALDTYTEL